MKYRNDVRCHILDFELKSDPHMVSVYYLDCKLLFEFPHPQRKAVNRKIIAKEGHLCKTKKEGVQILHREWPYKVIL